MSITQAPPVPFGRQLGLAATAARALLDQVLVCEATTFETWVVLNLLATSEPAMRRVDLAARLLAGLKEMEPAAADQLLGQLEQFGLIRTSPVSNAGQERVVEITEQGMEHFQRLFAVITRMSGRALEGIDPADVETTLRVLGQFRQQAEAHLAS